ncbi:MAG: hypothetical protein K2H82_07360 [Oscillospiraceae bacterium]|nr:hypothetical protein [Oscillospiraceae bacterium]
MGFFNLGKKKQTQNSNQDLEQNQDPENQEKRERMEQFEKVFFETIDRKREEDPLIGAKFGAKEIYSRLIDNLKESDNRLNVDNLLLFASGLAGISCQMTVIRLAEQKQIPETGALIVVQCENGRKYFMGDNLNYFLLENQYSVYSLLAGIYQHLAPEHPLPDIHAYAGECVKNLGNENYKIWGRITEPEVIALNLKLWNAFYPIAEKFCKTPQEIPILFGLVLQHTMETALQVLEPEKCLSMALENILYSAKLNYLEKLK